MSAATPQERLAEYEASARFRVVIISIVCAAALFIEFLLGVTLPVKNGYDNFLYFQRVRFLSLSLFFFFFFSLFPFLSLTFSS